MPISIPKLTKPFEKYSKEEQIEIVLNYYEVGFRTAEEAAKMINVSEEELISLYEKYKIENK